MNILDRLISDNEKYKAQFKENKLFKIKFDSDAKKNKFLDYFQIWSNEFQKTLLARVVFSEHKKHTKLAWEHLIDEFGHNIQLSNDRKNILEVKDSIFEALGSWFIANTGRYYIYLHTNHY